MPKTYPTPAAFSKEKRPSMALIPVTSGQVKAIGYDAGTRTLAVEFNRGTGALYCYPNVSRETYEEFRGAESIGTYFGKHIKSLPFEKFAPEAEA